MGDLLSVVDSDVMTSDAIDDKTDLPQVHALHILKAIFRESSLVTSAMLFMERACVLCVEAFESSVWAVRNAATQLFSEFLSTLCQSQPSIAFHLLQVQS